MFCKPTKKELKQVKELNKGYQMAVKGLNIMSRAINTHGNTDIGVFYYRAVKNLDNIIKSTYKFLEIKYIDDEFKRITKKKTK